MTIRWLTGFFDFPAAQFEIGKQFWVGVTDYAMSPPRGPRGDFATLVPGEGDAYLRLQRIYDAPAGCHLDFHALDWAEQAVQADGLGARRVFTEDGLAVFRSPGGLPFCVSGEDGGPSTPPAIRWPCGPVSRVDQFCLDIPADAYEAECGFWADLTGWEPHDSPLTEFRHLTRQTGMPLRLLLQRTNDPPGTTVRAHPDLACSGVEAEVSRHEELGAAWSHDGDGWIAMRDPTGLPYCITRRDPRRRP
jgi:glyoxalase superfamily protein